METKQTSRPKIKSSKLMNSLFVWNFKAAFHWKGIEFQDFRPYGPSDDAKYIDWLASSREGNTIMRRYREEKGGNILCLIDFRESLEFSQEKKKLVTDISELLYSASIATWEAFGWFKLDARTPQFVKPLKSRVALLQLISFPEKYKNIHTALSLDFLVKNRGKRSVVFVISDSLDIDEKSFQVAAMKHDLIYIHISSHFENMLEGKGIYELRDGNSSISIDLDDTRLVNTYRQKRRQQLEDFWKKLKALWVDSLFLDEQSSLFAEFLTLMKQRETRRS